MIIWKRTAAGDVVQTQLPSHAIVRLNGDPNLDSIASSKFSGDLLDVLLRREIPRKGQGKNIDINTLGITEGLFCFLLFIALTLCENEPCGENGSLSVVTV